MNHVDDTVKIKPLKYCIEYFIIFLFVYLGLVVYELFMYCIEVVLKEIWYKALESKKLEFLLESTKIKIKFDGVLGTFTLGMFNPLHGSWKKRFLKILGWFIKSLFSINFITYISFSILIIYSKYELFSNIIKLVFSNLGQLIQFNNISNALTYIWNIQFDKIKILATIGLISVGVIYFINKIKYKQYSAYERFETELRELENEKIKKVVIYQEELLEVLNELYYIIKSNIEPINDIFSNIEKEILYYKQKDTNVHPIEIYHNSKPFVKQLEEIKDYSESFNKANEIMKKIEDDKAMKVFKKYNRHFFKECISLGIYKGENLYFNNLKEIDKEFLKTKIEDIFNDITSNENENGNILFYHKMKLKNHRNDTIRYYIYLENYLMKFEKRRNKIMKYHKTNSKLKVFEDKFKIMK